VQDLPPSSRNKYLTRLRKDCLLKDSSEVGCVTKNVSTSSMAFMKDICHRTFTCYTGKGVTGCGYLILASRQLPTKAPLSFCLLNWTGKRKYGERLMGQDRDRERSLTNYRHGQNRLDAEKLI